MTDREKLARELEELVHLGSCAFVSGCHENLELADFILKHEIEARLQEQLMYWGDGGFTDKRWNGRIAELEKQLQEIDR